MAVLLLIAQAAAVTLILTKSTLFRVFREHGPAVWRNFAACPLCVGVWVGAALTLFQVFPHGWPETALGAPAVAVAAIGNGAAAGVVALLYMTMVEALEAITDAAERFQPPPAPAASIAPSSPRPPLVSEAPTDPFRVDEVPTGPAGYHDKTRPLSRDVILEAEKQIAKKNE